MRDALKTLAIIISYCQKKFHFVLSLAVPNRACKVNSKSVQTESNQSNLKKQQALKLETQEAKSNPESNGIELC